MNGKKGDGRAVSALGPYGGVDWNKDDHLGWRQLCQYWRRLHAVIKQKSRAPPVITKESSLVRSNCLNDSNF